MNSSENLICLSDSGIGSSLLTCGGRVDTAGANPVAKTSQNEVGDTGLLIDLTDEVQVPVPQALMTLAEVDDTFGIFANTQSTGNGQQLESSKEEASKMVRSFTWGRKSDGVQENEDAVVNEAVGVDKKRQSEEKAENNQEDSVGSSSSEPPTILDPEGFEALSPFNTDNMNDDEKDDKGIMEEEKMEANLYASGGSDSEILDINNLSSFSLPDVDLDENEYLENIRNENSFSTAIVDQIKTELLQNENRKDETELLDNATLPSFASTAATRSRLSTASVVSTSTRLSTASCKSDDACSQYSRSRISNVSSISRLSGILSSPIRTSYPLTRYYLPTPSKASGVGVRDKLSQSINSPNLTRVVVTGGARRSPTLGVPVRKSISAETLHYDSPLRDTTRTVCKYSTPKASSRYSLNVQSHQLLDRQNTYLLDKDAASGALDYHLPTNLWDRARDVTQERGRPGRLSAASSASSTSVNALSPTGSTSSVYRGDLSEVVRHMHQLRLNESSKISKPGIQGKTFAVQPMKATAVIPPTNISMAVVEPETKKAPANTRPDYSNANPPGTRKFIPPIASSSPKTAPSPGRPTRQQTTPSRTRYNTNVRSSGYGPQNLNSTFGAKPPLTSPNPKVPSSTTIKPVAIPKSFKSNESFSKPEIANSGTTAMKSNMPALKPKASIGTTTGLRRPTTGTTGTNKENIRAVGTRLGFARPRP